MSAEPAKKKNWVYWLLFIVTIVVVFIIGMLTTSVVERRAERVAKLQPVTEIEEWETNNSVWGENYPREYETYLDMKDTSFRSMFGGSARIDYLELYPELVVLWAGYGFSKGYEQGRGHIYAINDIRNIMRTGGLEDSPMPSTCWSCKSPDVPRLMNEIGVAEFYKGTWFDKGHEIINPIGCLDCHDPKTMNLRLSRPALIEALERQGKKVEDITHQEMRSLVCAQCHVEYYFKKDGNYLTFPWDKGYSVEDMEEYYDNYEFADWTHKLSRAPMLKAQHPDYELFKTGIHYRRNVACADCHMPYKVSGGIKFTDHHIQSPLNAISISCQVCHRESEEQLMKDVYDQQQKVLQIRRIAEKAIAKAHIEAKICWDNGATEEQMAPILILIRHAQWRWDWAAASNSMGFHSPVEILRVLGTSIEKAEKARGMLSVVLVKLDVPIPIEFPDISTKEKAQQFVGLDIEFMNKDKEDLLKKIEKDWGETIIR
jgi:nitrite reductase (cytochrome c-552)